MKIAFIIISMFLSLNVFGQIEGYWEYKKNNNNYILKIEANNNVYSGKIIKAISKNKNVIAKFNKIFMVDFKKTKQNTYKGYFILKNNKKHKGRIIQTNNNTIQTHYKWILFNIKDSWKRIK